VSASTGTALQVAIRKLAAGDSLSNDETRGAFELVMSGEASPIQLTALSVWLRV